MSRFWNFHQSNLVLIALISELLAFWRVSDFTEIAVVLRKYELGLLVSVFRRRLGRIRLNAFVDTQSLLLYFK